MTAAWVTGTSSLTDPLVAAALADAGYPDVVALHLGPTLLTPLAVGRSGGVTVVVGDVPVEDLLLAANVDDLDPRVWPGVLAGLLAAGAVDAWLTPILMKKGRPAHTVSALVSEVKAPAVRDVLLTQTTSIGLRVSRISKTALDRQETHVNVDGQQVRVKIAYGADGTVANVMPEWDDVAAAAAALGRPTRRVLLQAHAAAASLWDS